jgi:hypothetical protein
MGYESEIERLETRYNFNMEEDVEKIVEEFEGRIDDLAIGHRVFLLDAFEPKIGRVYLVLDIEGDIYYCVCGNYEKVAVFNKDWWDRHKNSPWAVALDQYAGYHAVDMEGGSHWRRWVMNPPVRHID